MRCSKCNCDLKESNKFCENCDKNSISNIPNENIKLKKLKNLNKICSVFYFLASILVFILVIKLLFEDWALFLIYISEIFLISPFFYLFNVSLKNYANSKLININEQKTINELEKLCTGFTLFITIYEMTTSFDNNIFSIALIIISLSLFLVSIKKSKILRDINHNEREKISFKKQNIILAIIIGIVLFIIPIITPIDRCNKIYRLNKEQLDKELKAYEIVSVNTIDYNAGGSLSCRTKETQTIIGFKDKYNNYIKTEVSDSEEGSLRKDFDLTSVANIQFVNNVLKNKLIKTSFSSEVHANYSLELDDEYLNDLFNSTIRLYNEYDLDKDIISEYDIKEKEYKLYLYLSKKDSASISFEIIKDYINDFVNDIIEIIGNEHVKEIKITVDKMGYYTLNNYNGQIIWEYYNY